MTICPKTNGKCYGESEIDLLFEVSTQLMKSSDITQELTPVLRTIALGLGLESLFLSILNRNSSSINIETAYGLSDIQKLRGQYKIGEGIIGRVVENGKPVVISRVSKSRLFLNKTRQQLIVDGKELNFICVPLIIDNVVVGTLSGTRLFNAQISANEDLRLLGILGTLMAESVRGRQDRMEELELLKKENQNLHQKLDTGFKPANIIGNSGKMKDLFSLLEMVAKTSTTVLIRGESGCGKELIADALHNESLRKKEPFIKVNCSALPDTLIESELFGYEKGAFTGATESKKGRFELAHKGTIFLDEIGELPLATQVKLLRFLQERELERIGGVKTIKVDVRVVCATNRNLEKAIEEGSFREDLFYRINVFPLFIPNLRERRNDIPLLVDHFIEKFNKQNNTSIKRITTSAINMLMVYAWPGNIRELENLIERACILSRDDVIHSYQLPPTLQTAESSNTGSKGGLSYVVEKIERQLIIEALMQYKGNMTKAAKELKITERMLGTRVQKYKIEVWRYKL